MSEKENMVRLLVTSFNYGDGDEIKISRLVDELKDIESKGATHVELFNDNEWDSVDFTFYKYRPETEDEREVRIRREEFNKAMEEEAEMAEYERLKEKFEKQ
jgi:hypothetical protein